MSQHSERLNLTASHSQSWLRQQLVICKRLFAGWPFQPCRQNKTEWPPSNPNKTAPKSSASKTSAMRSATMSSPSSMTKAASSCAEDQAGQSCQRNSKTPTNWTGLKYSAASKAQMQAISASTLARPSSPDSHQTSHCQAG